MAPKIEKIDLSLTNNSQTSMDKFEGSLAKSEKRVDAVNKKLGATATNLQKLVDLYKKLSDVEKALNAKGALNNLDGYQAGLQAKANRRTGATILSGNRDMVSLENEKQRAQLATDYLKKTKEAQLNQEAMAVSIRKAVTETKKITDLEQLQNNLLVARRRLGIEGSQSDAAKIKSAQQLVTAIEKRMAVLQQEKMLADELARVSAKQAADATKAAAVLTQAETARANAAKASAAAEKQRNLEISRAALAAATATDNREKTRIGANQMAARADAARLKTEALAQRVATREAEALARAEAKAEAQRIRAANNTPKAVAERGREMANERLFGDGGANLLKVQAGLAANYMLLGAVRTGLSDALTFSTDLDASLRNLQAIVVISDQGLKGLKDRLVEVAQGTRFSAVELSDAAVILGQAGLSLKQIESSIKAVALLATASGTDLASSVDLVTSVLGVFNLEAGQTAQVANVLTEAVNSSKLDIEKLALGLQYAGNTAAESGLGFEELTAALGAMSNTGIRSGSTLGTGMRQILISLQKPSKAFSGTLERLGLTLSDVDVRTHGLYGAMKNLEAAGFTAGDAIHSFEIRGAAAYTALSKNLDQMLQMETSFYGTSAAITANNTQMRSLESQAARAKNSLMAMIANGLEPLTYLTRDIFKGFADMLGSFDQTGISLKVLVVGATTLVGLALGAWAVSLAGGFLAMGLGGVAAAGGLTAISTAALAAQASLGFMAATSVVLTPFIPLILGVTAAVGIGAMAWAAYSKEMAEGNTALARAKTALEESTGVAESYAAKIVTVSTKLQELNDRSETLTSDNKLMAATVRSVKSEFSAMGLDVKNVVGTVDGLVTSLLELRKNLTEEYVIKLRIQRGDNETLQKVTADQKARALEEAKAALLVTGRRDFTPQRVGQGFPSALKGPASQFDTLAGDFSKLGADPSTDELNTLNNRNSELMLELARKNPDISAIEASLNKQYLAKAKKFGASLEAALGFSKDADQYALNLEAIVAEQATSDSKGLPVYQQAEADGMAIRTRINTGVEAIRKRYAGDAIGGDAAIQQLVKLEAANLDKLDTQLQGLVDAGTITEDAAEVIYGDTTATRLLLNEVGPGSSANAKPVREERLKQKIQRLEEAKVKLTEALSKADNMAAFDQGVEKLLENEIAYKAALAEEAGLALDADASSGEVQASNMALNAAGFARRNKDRADREAARRRLTAGQMKGYAGSRVASNASASEAADELELAKVVQRYGENSAQADNLRLSREREIYRLRVLQMQVAEDTQRKMMAAYDQANPKRNPMEEKNGDRRSAGAAAIVARNAARTAAVETIKNLNEEARIRQLITKYGEDSAQVEHARVLAAREVYAATLDVNLLGEEIVATQMAAWDAANNSTAATWAWAEAMGAVGAQIRGILGALSQISGTMIGAASLQVEIKALKAGKTAAAARIEAETSQIEADSNYAIANATSLPEKGLLWVNKKLKLKRLDMETEATELRANAPTPKGKGKGGSGSASDKAAKAAKKGFDGFMDSLEGNLGAATNDSGASQAARFKQILDTARAELAQRKLRIDGMKGQTLSTEKQKELNRLVEEQGKLTEFIYGAQEKIIKAQGVQGNMQNILTLSLKDFAAQHLNLAETMRSGLGNVLGSWKSGMTEFFTSVSDGTKTGGQAFRDFAVTVVKSLQGVVAEMLAVYAIKKLLGWVGGMIGGNFGASLTEAADGMKMGGLVTPKGMAAGGAVSAQATAGRVTGKIARDSELRMLMPDEYVLRASAVQMIGVDNLDRINQAGNIRMASGGRVSGVARATAVNAGGQPLNIWMAPPDQRPIPGANDIIAVITDDMARGGATKQLIKQINRGSI